MHVSTPESGTNRDRAHEATVELLSAEVSSVRRYQLSPVLMYDPDCHHNSSANWFVELPWFLPTQHAWQARRRPVSLPTRLNPSVRNRAHSDNAYITLNAVAEKLLAMGGLFALFCMLLPIPVDIRPKIMPFFGSDAFPK